MDDPQTQYWLIKAILLTALVIIMWVIVRPVRTQGHLALRRVITVLTLVFAMFAILFPGLLNRVAWRLGVDRGINLLVYVLVLALFAQIATAYRRDSTAEKRLTELARAIALNTVQVPGAPAQAAGSTSAGDDGATEVGGADWDQGDSPGASHPGDTDTAGTAPPPEQDVQNDPDPRDGPDPASGSTIPAEWSRASDHSAERNDVPTDRPLPA